MAKVVKSISLLEEKVINKIYLIRDKKVMLDFDLAELYGVGTIKKAGKTKSGKTKSSCKLVSTQIINLKKG